MGPRGSKIGSGVPPGRVPPPRVGPLGAPEAPRGPQGRLGTRKWSQKGPQTSSKDPKMDPKRPQTGSKRALGTPSWVENCAGGRPASPGCRSARASVVVLQPSLFPRGICVRAVVRPPLAQDVARHRPANLPAGGPGEVRAPGWARTAPRTGRELAENCPRSAERGTGKTFRAPVSRKRLK